ncbi:MAG: serine hydrolase domain-containing protein [Ilumatobacteraceae bacterium]
MDVRGTYDDRFQHLATLLHDSVERGADLGGSVALVIDGEMVVDIWDGWADPERTIPWERDTITNVWSTTKTMTALAALVLVDRGELDIHAPVARYWPEFAANGKDAVEVRHLMSHTSGVAGWDQPVTLADILDPVASVERLAAQAPWWKPGSASGYHGINQGHLIGEVVRRITGKSLGTFFADEIAGPLGADFHIGLDARHDARVATVVPPPPMEFDLDSMDQTSPGFRFFVGPVVDPAACNTADWRRAEIGAAGGQGNARSVARIQSAVSHGGDVDGVHLLSPATIDLIFEEQSNGVDLCLGIPLRFGVGYALVDTEHFPYLPDSRICFWGGWGGSMVINDLDRRMTFAYMMNKMEAGIIGGVRSEALIRSVYDVLGVPLRP